MEKKTWTIAKYLKGDPLIWVIAFALSLFSILVVYSATGSLAYRRMGGDTEYYLVKHLLLTLISLLLMWVMHRIDYRYYLSFSKLGLWISVPLLLLTLKFGLNINEATRWIMVPFIDQSFQPADFARLVLFIHVAGVLAKCQRDQRDLRAAMVPILFWSASICGLVALSGLLISTVDCRDGVSSNIYWTGIFSISVYAGYGHGCGGR